MRVLTFHHPVPGLEDPLLIEKWKDSWRRFGFQPFVLDYGCHRAYPELVRRFESVRPWFHGDSGNPPAYQEACIYRWLAVAGFMSDWYRGDDDPVMMVDWDVINYSLRPSKALHVYEDTLGGMAIFNVAGYGGSALAWGFKLVRLAKGARAAVCPAVVCARPAAFYTMAEWFIRHAERNQPFGARHDEDIMRGNTDWPVPTGLYLEAPRLNWEERRVWLETEHLPALVHFSNGTTKERPRSAAVDIHLHPFRHGPYSARA